ncbi:hypothetical protein BC943DRAFT_46382 [Umbelopsis sp. AD052]|nr:hypothetical protein BC943DRAFT_46382 [Umbelopsis sp. AD052]
MACDSCGSRKVYCDLAVPTCGQCEKSGRECIYRPPTLHLREEDVVKLSSSVGELGSTVSELQNDLTHVLHSVNSLLALKSDQTSSKQIISDIASTSEEKLFISQKDCDLYLTDKGISIEFRTENICFQKLRDLLYSSLFTTSEEPVNSENDTALVPTARIPVYTQPSFLLVPLYNAHPTIYQIDPPAFAGMLENGDIMNQLLDIFFTCYVGYQIPCKEAFRIKFFSGGIEPFLMNAMTAWACKHSAVFHGMFLGSGGEQAGEPYYQLARDQLSECMFDRNDVDCVFALLLLYGYHVGKASATLSCRRLPGSYLHLGMATQMALELKMHVAHPELPEELQETYRRLWSLIYFLDALAVGQTDKPTMMIPDHAITVLPQAPLSNEDVETCARVQYARCRTDLRKLFRKITSCMQFSEVEISTIHDLNIEIDELRHFFDTEVNHISPNRRVGAEFSAQGYYKLSIDTYFLKIQLFFPMTNTSHQENVDIVDARNICFDSAQKLLHLVYMDAASNSPWCLYSVESSWTAAAVLEYFHREGTDEQKAISSQELAKLKGILLSSNLSRHWPMAKLIEYIG